MTLLDNLKRPNSRRTLSEKSLQALRSVRDKRQAGPSIELGSSNQPGRVLRVIKNYSGVNTSCGKDRTLVVRDGRCGKRDPPQSSLPDWFGPGYYTDVDRAFTATRRGQVSASSVQVPFKNTGREEDRGARGGPRDRYPAPPPSSSCSSSEQLMCGDEAFEEHEHSQLYGSSTSRVQTASSAGRSPRYRSPSSCRRLHSQHVSSDMHTSPNPWSRTSTRSTMAQPVTQSGLSSPTGVLMSPPLSYNSIRDGLIDYDDVLCSEFMDGVQSRSQSSHHSRATTQSGLLTASSVDSLLLKGAKRDRAKFKLRDYTMGGLSLQQSMPLVIPDPQDDDLQQTDTSSPNRFTGPKEVDYRTKFAITSTDSAKYNAAARRDSRRRHHPPSRAAMVLADVRSDLLSEKSSLVLDEEIPFSESMNSYVDKWRSERNLVSTKPLRPKSSGPRDPAPQVDFSQLLMDDSDFGGLSAEESQTLLSQYTEEFSTELNFL